MKIEFTFHVSHLHGVDLMRLSVRQQRISHSCSVPAIYQCITVRLFYNLHHTGEVGSFCNRIGTQAYSCNSRSSNMQQGRTDCMGKPRAISWPSDNDTSFIGSIGKLFGDGGLIQILTGSEVYADATVSSMLQGKQYSRGLRGIRLAHEALTQLFLSSAEMFATNKSLLWFDDDTMQLIRNLENAFKLKSAEACIALCEEIEIKISPLIMETIERFKQKGREMSVTFQLWLNCLEAGDILLKLLRADHTADFEMHLDAVYNTIPYFFMAGCTNYARYLSGTSVAFRDAWSRE